MLKIKEFSGKGPKLFNLYYLLEMLHSTRPMGSCLLKNTTCDT